MLASLYTQDCEHVIINRNSPPSRPTVLKGREAMRKMFADIFAREMTHCLENAVIGNDRIAFHKSCQYPDGTRVVLLTIAELREARSSARQDRRGTGLDSDLLEYVFEMLLHGARARAELKNAGFAAVSEEVRTVPAPLPGSPEKLWQQFYDVAVPLQLYIDSFSAREREAALPEVYAGYRVYFDGRRTDVPVGIVVASAQR